MPIKLFPPLALHQKGQRKKNEDYIYPTLAEIETSLTSRFFLVCDGVGGAEKGEEASRIVCESFAQSLQVVENIEFSDIERALAVTESNIDNYLKANPEAEGMATTLTLVVFNAKGVIIAHVGDSRVYHLRQGAILFKTLDHSLVNEMVLNNIITEEEATNHPKRNVVLRAIMGSQRPAKLDMVQITDVQPDDYFFLCTDGIIESVSDIMLASIIGEKENSDNFKLTQIFTLCDQYSKDNFSAYLLRIESISSNDKSMAQSSVKEKENKSSGLFPKWLAYLLIFSSILALGILLCILLPKKSIPDNVNATPEPHKTGGMLDNSLNKEAGQMNYIQPKTGAILTLKVRGPEQL